MSIAALAKISLDNRQIPIRVQLGSGLTVQSTGIRKPRRTKPLSGASVPAQERRRTVITQGPFTSSASTVSGGTIGAKPAIGCGAGYGQEQFNESGQIDEFAGRRSGAGVGRRPEVQKEMSESFLNCIADGAPCWC